MARKPDRQRNDRAALTTLALARYLALENADGLVIQSTNHERSGEPMLVKGYDSSIENIAGTDGNTNNVLTYAITTDSIDRANDRVDPQGMDIRNYSLNSPILWSHDHSEPNIGKGRNPRYSARTNQGRRGVLMEVEYHLITPLSRDIHAMAVAGFLPACSIGFIPTKWEDAPVEEFRRAGEYVYPFTDTVRTYTGWELLELSPCNVPMNPTAVLQSDFAKSLSAAVERGVIAADAEIVKRCGGGRIVTGKEFSTTSAATEFVLPSTATSALTGMFDALASGAKSGEEALREFADTADALVIRADQAIDDAPNYRDSDGPAASCAACEYNDDGTCMRHDFEHGGASNVCDDFEAMEADDEESADKTYLDTLTQLPSDMKDLSSIAAKAGITTEQLTAVIEAAKANEGGEENKAALDDKLAVRDVWEEIWQIHAALCSVVEEAATAYVEEGDEKLLKALPDSYKSAAEKIIEAVKVAKKGGTKSFAPGAIERAGAVLSTKNQAALTEARDRIDSVLAQAKKEDTKGGEAVVAITVEGDAPALTVTRGDEIVDVMERIDTMDNDIVAIKTIVSELRELLGYKAVEIVDDETNNTAADDEPTTEEKTIDETPAVPVVTFRFKGDTATAE